LAARLKAGAWRWTLALGSNKRLDSVCSGLACAVYGGCLAGCAHERQGLLPDDAALALKPSRA